MLKRTDVLSRVWEDKEYPSIFTIDKLCNQDLSASQKEYELACAEYETALKAYNADNNSKTLHEKHLAAVKVAYAWAHYIDKVALHSDFIN